MNKARFWRRMYLLFALFLGVASPLLCWYMIPDFNPIEKPLSYFGVAEPTFLFWNFSLLLLALGIYLNGKASFRLHKKVFYRKVLYVMLLTSAIALVLTAAVSMEYALFHQLVATCFFLVYNFFVFCFGLFQSFQYVRKGMASVVTGSLMLLSSLLLLPFPSYGVFELVYLSLVIYWNAQLLYKRYKREGRIMRRRRKRKRSYSGS